MASSISSRISKTENSQFPLILALASLVLTALPSLGMAQPSVADNIRPVGSVCLAGQPCVGQPAATRSAMPTATEATAIETDVTDATEETVPAVTSTQPEPVPALTMPAPETVAVTAVDAPADEDMAPEPVATAASSTVAPEPAAVSDFDVQATYNMSCMACHTTGAAGAPRIGDQSAWEPRLEKGMDALMQNVYNGINAMPARGLCMTCTDDQLRTLVDYMINQ